MIKAEAAQPFVGPPDPTWLYPSRPPMSITIFRCYWVAPMRIDMNSPVFLMWLRQWL